MPMKRVSVAIDDEVREKARQFLDERTYRATITRALERLVHEDAYRKLRVEWEDLAAAHPIVRDGYVELIVPSGYCVIRTNLAALQNRRKAARCRKRRA